MDEHIIKHVSTTKKKKKEKTFTPRVLTPKVKAIRHE